jgi:uncharacterized protein (TIGR03067 family)
MVHRLLLLGLFTGITLVSAQPPVDAQALKGSWTPIEFKLAGKSGVSETVKNFKLTLTETSYSLDTGKGVDKGTLKVDAGKTPPTMDVTGVEGPNQGKTILAIWKVEGDKLHICYALDGKSRPTAFESTMENGWLLAIYQRVK